MSHRTFFIGDVHGCYDELMELVDKIGLGSEDHLYFVGDLINKGPKSREVLDWIMHRPNTWSVVGNHEYFSFLDEQEVSNSPFLTENQKGWVRNGLPKYTELRGDLSEHQEWITSLPAYIETDDFIVLHAGINPEYSMKTPIEIMTLIRNYEGRPWYEYYTGEKIIIYGHWAVDGLRIRKNTIGLDTGCCFGGHLTAYCLEDHELWQVRAHKVYKEPAHWRGKVEE